MESGCISVPLMQLATHPNTEMYLDILLPLLRLGHIFIKYFPPPTYVTRDPFY